MRKLAVCLFILTAMGAPALAQPEGTLTYSQDARTEASDADVRVARRAYRAACEQRQTTGYCECMTGGMAQSLAPNDLGTATRLLAHDLGNAAMPSGLDRASVERARAASAMYEPSCAQFRR